MTLMLIQTTTRTSQQAQAIASVLIERTLAACVQVAGPVTSVYRWQGKIEQHEEYILTAKALERDYPQVADAISTHHPYETPEIIAMPICQVSPDYLAWVKDSVK